MALTLETMQGSTGIMMRHQSEEGSAESVTIRLVSSYTAQEPLPSIHPVAKAPLPRQ
jgi:hypothetical protein